MNKLTTFYLVRHGETDWNKKHIVQGQQNIVLNQTGVEQAKDVAKDFKGLHFDLAFTSDLLRAKRTAEIITLEHELALETTELMRERKFGSLEGKPSHILHTLSQLMLKLTEEERLKHRVDKDAENDEEFIARIFTFLRETAIAYPGGNIFVATHAGVLRIIMIHLGMMSFEEFETMRFVNGGYIKLTSDGIDFFIEETHGLQERQKGSSEL